MLITLSHRTTICKSVTEIYLIVVDPLGDVTHIFIFLFKQRNEGIYRKSIDHKNEEQGRLEEFMKCWK